MALDVQGTDYLKLPVGTTAQRPAVPATGMTRQNSTTGLPEWYDTVSSSWIAFNNPISSGAPAFSASMSTTQSLTTSTYTLIPFDTKTGGINFDTNSNFNTSNSRFTPTVAGYYQINISYFVNAGSGQVYLLIYKNGAASGIGIYLPNNATAGAIPAISGLLYCNGSTDYISAYIFQSSGGTLTGCGGTGNAQFSAAMIRSA